MRALLLLCLVWGQAWATTYYADPAGSGVACTVGSPCTLSQCTTTASTGDTCSLNAGTYDLTTSGVNFVKNLTYTSTDAPCSAVLTSTNATRTVAMNPANNATPLVVSNLSINGSSSANVVQVGDQAFDVTATFTGNCVTTGGTNRHFSDAYLRGTVNITNNSFTGTVGAQAVIASSGSPSSAKKIVISGNTIDVTTSTNVLVPIILVQRSAGSSTSWFTYVADNVISAIAPPALGTSAAINGIRLDRITSGTDLDGVTTPPIIEGNTITVTATASNLNDTDAIVASSTDATAHGNGVIIRNNTVTCNSGVARCISIGIDAATQSYVDNSLVYGNTVNGTYYDGVATPHGISLGRVNGGRVYANKVTGFAAAILAGINNGGVISGNIVRGAQYVSLFAKGNTAVTFTNNTVIQDSSVYGANFGSYGAMGTASQGATNNAATLFTNNNIYCLTACRTYVTVDAAQVATFQSNNYYSVVAPSEANPWSYQGSGQSSLAGWQGAQESTAISSDPLFAGSDLSNSNNLRLKAGSALRRAGKDLNIGNIQDAGNRALLHPPSIGAWEAASGDAAAARTAR
jgi:hypothetical protein